MYYLIYEAFTSFCRTCVLINTVVELLMKRGILVYYDTHQKYPVYTWQFISKNCHVLHIIFLTAGLTEGLISALDLFCFVLYFALPFTALYFIKAVTRSLILYSCLYLMMTMTNALIVWNMQSTWMCTSDTRPLQNLLRFISLDGTLNCITFTGTHLKSAQYTKSTYIGKIELPPPKKKKKKSGSQETYCPLGDYPSVGIFCFGLLWSMDVTCRHSTQLKSYIIQLHKN